MRSLMVSSPPDASIRDFDPVVVDGRLLVVATHDVSRHVCTWDPADDRWTEHELDNPFADEDEGDYTEIFSLGAAVCDGRIVIGGGGDHQGFALWDLETGGVRLFAEPGGVGSATAADFGGRTLMVVGQPWVPGVSLWDPAVEEPEDDEEEDYDEDRPSAYDFLTSVGGLEPRSYASSAVAAGMLGRRRVVVANSHHGGVIAWDLDSSGPLAEFGARDETPTDFALTAVDGRPLVVAAGQRQLVLGDPGTGEWSEPLTVPGGEVSCLEAGTLRGRPVAVTGGQDGTVCLWDLADRSVIGQPSRDCGGEIYGLRLSELDGRPVLIGAARLDSMRIWQLPA